MQSTIHNTVFGPPSANMSGIVGEKLHDAISLGQLDVVRSLLDQGADVNAVGGRYSSALAAAAHNGNSDIVSLLLDRGANVNLVGRRQLLERGADLDAVLDSTYGTPLVAAAFGGHRGVVSLLLDRGADVRAKGGIALTMAAIQGYSDIVSTLLDRGADVNLVNNIYGSALIGAAYAGKLDMVSLLLDREADINVMMVGISGPSALAAAASEGYLDVVSLLLDRGADVHAKGGIALITAAVKGRWDIVSFMLDRGADVNLENSLYGSALMAAAYAGQLNIISLLLDRGADIDAVTTKISGASTALALAASKHRSDVVSLLLDRGADVNTVCGKFGTALGEAAVSMSPLDMLSLLLDRGADVNKVGGHYGSSLATAAYTGNPAVVSLLLDHGADVNMVCGAEYGTALSTAALHGKASVVSLLLDRGADVNAVAGMYGTALAAAAASTNNLDVVSLLLDRGADVNTVGGKYGSPLATATSHMEQFGCTNTVIVLLLLRRGADINLVHMTSTGKYGTAFQIVASEDSLHDAGVKLNSPCRLFLERGADMNVVVGKYGSELGRAIYQGRLKYVQACLALPPNLGTPADILWIGGSYQTVSGLYPNALDVALAQGSKASQELITQIQNVMEQQMNAIRLQPVCPTTIEPDTRFEFELLFRPPFPMAYSGPVIGALSNVKAEIPSLNTFREGDFITPQQADMPCQQFTQDVLARALVALVGLDELTAERLQHFIQSDIQYFIARKFDFGLAYAAARIAWKQGIDEDSMSVQRGKWHRRARELDEQRCNAIGCDSDQELIQSPYSIMPRRVWDVKSNRVVEFRMLHAAVASNNRPKFWAISHSWTSNMHSIETPINQRQWQVPLPHDMDLEKDLRSELLLLGAEYVWLDVLCLRQHDGPSPAGAVDKLGLKQEEWKLDVPTIGNIYRAAERIVRYFNGLGIQFSNEGWDSNRHWLNRAWTLQEITTEHTTINGGISRGKRSSILNIKGERLGKECTLREVLRPVLRLAQQVDIGSGCSMYDLAREMFKRHSTMAVDKLSGLFYLLRTSKLPCYHAERTDEEIWRQSFHLLPITRQIEILCDFPYRGFDDRWIPTWAQVMRWPEQDPSYEHASVALEPFNCTEPSDLRKADEASIFVPQVWMVPNASLERSKMGVEASSEYKVKTEGRTFEFYNPYIYQDPIDTGSHQHSKLRVTLATLKLGQDYNWIICEALEKRTGTYMTPRRSVEIHVLRKLGVLRTDCCSELLAGGRNGRSLLEQGDCLFV